MLCIRKTGFSRYLIVHGQPFHNRLCDVNTTWLGNLTMVILNRTGLITRYALGLLVVVFLTACGGSGSDNGTSEQPLSDATAQGLATGPIAEDPVTAEFTPTPGDGLDPIYSDPGLAIESNNEFIVAQWLHMQNCMQVSAVEPEVTVVDEKITPLSATDDVVRHIDGMIQASSNVTDTGASIQIRAADFDGSLGKPGLYLRSIMGRYLWLANGYAERDYPYECAKGGE